MTMFRFFPTAQRAHDTLTKLAIDLVGEVLCFSNLMFRSRSAVNAEIQLFRNQLAFCEEPQMQLRRPSAPAGFFRVVWFRLFGLHHECSRKRIAK